MLLYVISLAAVVVSVAGHGRVLEPPSRASMWRMGFSTRANYDDTGLNCGGFFHQYSVTGGKCGICGDPFDQRQPRNHELGGIYGSGIITARYDQGQVFTATVDLTVYHKGYWEFRICTDPQNNNQECFDEYLVELENGETKYYPTGAAIYTLNYRLPAGLVCEHCVLQWRYTAGNNWGNCGNGTQAVGCGNQETFGACSDISIGTVEISSLNSPIELPAYIINSIDEIQGFLQLLHKTAVRPKQPPKRDTPILYQKKKHRRKHRGKNIKTRKRKKFI